MNKRRHVFLVIVGARATRKLLWRIKQKSSNVETCWNRHFTLPYQFKRYFLDCRPLLVLLLVLVELELMGWVRKVQFLMQKGDTEFQTGTIRNPRLHMAPLSWRTSLLLQPAQSKLSKLQIIRLLFAVHCLQQLAQAALVPHDSILQFLDKIRYLRTGPKQDWHATKSYKVWKTYVGPLGVPAVSVIFSDAKPVEGN